VDPVCITENAFEPETLHYEFRQSVNEAGAIVAFTGLVRAEEKVTTLKLSHYPDFTENEIKKIGDVAQTRWNLQNWHISHRIGEMKPQEPIVFVATASRHRRQAFEAADFLMDYLKSEAPFWKQEYRGQESRWIEPRAQDRSDIKRWDS